MGLLGRVELLHTLDQLSNDQYATLVSQLFANDRSTTDQLLAGYFATTNNPTLATKIKTTAKSILQSQDPDEEPVAQTVMTDPHILSNIALFLPNCQIVRLELLCRRSFISLRKYPAIHTLNHYHIARYLKCCENGSVTLNTNRFRNVRDLYLDGEDIEKLPDCGPHSNSPNSHPIFKKVEKLKCDNVLDVVPKLMSLCDMTQLKSLSIAATIDPDVTSFQAKELMTLLLSCRNCRTLIFTDLDTSHAECIWTAEEIRERLTKVEILKLAECEHSVIAETLFEALSPQIHSFHLSEIEGGDNGTIKLSALLQKSSDLKNLKELCWSMYDTRDFVEGVGELIGCQMDKLERISLFNNESTPSIGVELHMDDDAKRNLVCLFKRNWSHIELMDDKNQFGRDLICCLKKGLMERQGRGNLCVVLPSFMDETAAEMDILDIVGILKMGNVEEFAVLRRDEPDEQIFKNVSGSVTLSNRYGYTCCRSIHFSGTSGIDPCNKCNGRLYADLL